LVNERRKGIVHGMVLRIGRFGLPPILAYLYGFYNPVGDAIDAGFLYWLFLSRAFNQHLFATATGSKILHTAPSRIESFRFSRPPLPIQRRIAAVLSAYDDLIANNQRRIAILEELARSLYREWFVEFRFPGHEGELSIDNIPNGWTNRKLSEVAQVNANSVRRGKEPTLIRYIDIASVSTGQVDNVEEIPFTEAPGRARRIVEHGDIIWSTVRPNRKSYSIILNPLPGTIVSTGFAVISATRLPFTYLYHALTTEDFVAYLTNHAKGSAYPAVSADDFTNAEILIPAENLLETYHAFAEEVLLQQEILSQKNANLRRTRDLLLPRLVSGELDVSELELAGVDAL